MKIQFFTVAISLFSLIGYGQPWQSIGPNDGYQIDEIIVAEDSSLMIIGNRFSPTIGHQVLQSLDNGGSWQHAVTNIQQGAFQRALLINSNGDYLLGVRDALFNDTYIARVNQAITSYTNQLYEDTTDGVFSLDRYGEIVYASGEECAVGNISCRYSSPRGTVYKSTDDGDTWQRMSSFPGPGGHDIQVLDSSIVFVKGRIEPALYFTLDGGATWDSAVAPQRIVGFKMITDSIGFIGTISGRIMETHDQGLTWSHSHTVGANAVSKIERAGDYLIAATQGAVAISKDGGTTWTNENLSQNRTVYDIAIAPAGTYLVCDEGRVYYKQEDLSQYFLNAEVSPVKRTHLFPYPNPVEDVSCIEFPEGFEPTLIKFYDSRGVEVEVPFWISDDKLTLRGNELPGGIYFYEIGNNKKIYSGSLMVK